MQRIDALVISVLTRGPSFAGVWANGGLAMERLLWCFQVSVHDAVLPVGIAASVVSL
jgi:hypothetical protein